MKKSTAASNNAKDDSAGVVNLKLRAHRACAFLCHVRVAIRVGVPVDDVRKRAAARLKRAKERCRSVKPFPPERGQANEASRSNQSK